MSFEHTLFSHNFQSRQFWNCCSCGHYDLRSQLRIFKCFTDFIKFADKEVGKSICNNLWVIMNWEHSICFLCLKLFVNLNKAFWSPFVSSILLISPLYRCVFDFRTHSFTSMRFCWSICRSISSFDLIIIINNNNNNNLLFKVAFYKYSNTLYIKFTL